MCRTARLRILSALLILLAGLEANASDADAACAADSSGSPPAFPLDGRVASTCGNAWQEKYAALHANALEQTSPRILVFDTNGNGGYADRLTGLMTALLLAIISDRALVLDWPGHEAALSMPRLGAGAELLLRRARAAAPGEVRRLSWLNANRRKLQAEMVGASMDTLWPERVVELRSNRGFTQQLLAAPVHAAAALERGLTPVNAQFGCLFNFLLRPTEAALRPLAPFFASVGDARYVTVGVHVRTGDAAFEKKRNKKAASPAASPAPDDGEQEQDLHERGRQLYASHEFILKYAEQLATSLAQRSSLTPPPKPRILLLGDSVAFRQYAAAVHGEERLLLPNSSVGHIAKQAPSETALLGAIGEHWLYSHAQAFVYSSHSGFPRTAAARALRDDSIHTCFHYSGPLFNGDQPTARECTGPYTVKLLGERHAAGL
jgi:hypothetical protein